MSPDVLVIGGVILFCIGALWYCIRYAGRKNDE